MTPGLASIITVIVIAAIAAFAIYKGRQKAATARAKSHSNEAAFLAAAQSITPTQLTPEELERRTKVAAAFGGEPMIPHQSNQSPAPKPAPVLPTQQMRLPTGPPTAMGFTEEVVEIEPAGHVADTAAVIAAQLRALADRVESISTGPGTDTDKADKILLALAKEWSSLPLSDLEDNQ